MGNIQSLPIDSYLDRHPCSGRNITWHYIHTNGSLQAPYSHCPYASDILSSHCCANGACIPGWFDREYARYQYADWDGLGDPYNDITNTNIEDWHNGTSNSTAVSGNNRFERPAGGGICLGMEPSLWFVGNHWPPLGLDGRPVEHFRQMEWGNSSVWDEYGQQQAMESNASTRSGRLEHRVVTSGAPQRKTITVWKLATWLLADLKAAIWRLGKPMNTVGFFMGILVGYLLCLETNGGAPQPKTIAPQTNPARNTSTAKTNKKKKKSRNTNVASQHNDLQPPSAPVAPQAPRTVHSQHEDPQVPNDLTPPPTSPPTPAPQNNDPQVTDVPIRPQVPRSVASLNNDPQNSSDLTPPISPPTPAPQRNYFAGGNSSTPQNEAIQNNDPQVHNDLAPPRSPPTPAPQNNYLAVGNSSTPPRYNVRERRRRYVDWGSLRRTENAGSQSTIETSSQQGSQSASQRGLQQGSRGASTDSDSQQIGAQHRNPPFKPQQRIS